MGGASRPRPHFWPTGRSRPSLPVLTPFPAPALAPTPCPRADGRAAPPWRAGRARLPRGEHAVAWTRPSRPPGAPGRARLRPRSHLRPPALPLSLSRPRSARAERRRRHHRRRRGASLPASSGLLLPLRDHHQLRLALLHRVLAPYRAR